MTQTSPSPDNFLLVGVIVAAFGMRGQVKVRAITDQLDHLQRRIKTIYIGDSYMPYQLTNLFEHKPGLLICTLKGITTREAAEDLRGEEVAILEADAAPLGKDEYYIHQLYNLRVETTEGVTIGRVREVLETGANEVLIVAREQQSDALIPMVRDIVQELDIPGGRVVIKLIVGLLGDES